MKVSYCRQAWKYSPSISFLLHHKGTSFPWTRGTVADKSHAEIMKHLTSWTGPDFKLIGMVFTSTNLSGQFYEKSMYHVLTQLATKDHIAAHSLPLP